MSVVPAAGQRWNDSCGLRFGASRTPVRLNIRSHISCERSPKQLFDVLSKISTFWNLKVLIFRKLEL